MSDTPTPTPSPAAPAAPAPSPSPTPAAPSGVQSPWFSELYDTSGKLNHAAFDRAPDHIKSQKDYFSKYPTIEDALFGSGNAFAKVGAKALAPLPENASDQMKAERKAHLDAINGVPSDIKGYGIKRPDNVPETQWNQAAADALATALQKYSGPPALAKELIQIQSGLVEQSIKQQQQAEATFIAEQNTNYKTAIQQQNLPEARANELVLRGAELLGINPKSPVFTTAEVRLACLKAQQLTAESKFIGDKSGDNANILDELAQARDIMGNPENPKYDAYRNPAHPNYKQVNEEVDRLYAAHGAKNGGGRR